ncbi:MAG: hypothetical protein KY445_00910 [Armatimonadetes bacterium]|nr:hypothetical protein [Armatimonadota bacterium]
MPSKTSWTEADLAHPDFQFFEKYGKTRVKETEKVLLWFCSWKGTEPFQGMDRRIRLGQWCESLSEIPVAQLLPLAQEETRHRTSDFFPTPANLHARRSGEETTLGEDGKPEKATRANVAAYESWDEQKARMERAARESLPESLPPLEIDPEELKRRLKSPHTEINSRRIEMEEETLSDEALLQRLICDCNMETFHPDTPHADAKARAATLAFGRWMLRHLGHEKWTPELAQEAWREWCQIQEQFIAAEKVAAG